MAESDRRWRGRLRVAGVNMVANGPRANIAVWVGAAVLIGLLVLGGSAWAAVRRMAGEVQQFRTRLDQLTDTRVTLPPAVPNAVRISRPASDVPPASKRDAPAVVKVDLEARELDGTLAEGTTFRYWTFDGTVPGPLIRVREGDTVELRLTNAPGQQIHNIDLHAVNGPGGGAKLTTVAPGEIKVFRFKALNPGLYIYHCAAPHIPTHIANGMYGLVLVEPTGGLPPVDREFYLVQGELYASAPPGAEGHAAFAAADLRREQPQYVVFNGQYRALTGDQAMRVRVGERVRLYVGNAGPNLTSSFHVIGEIFDVVHVEGGTMVNTNVQSTLIPAGGAAWVEFTVDVPGEYVVLDHSISRAMDKGALAVIVAEGSEHPAVFGTVSPEGEPLEQQSGW